MEKLKAILSKIKYYRVIAILIIIILTIAGFVLKGMIARETTKYYDQTVASRWDKDNNYSQISLFIKDTTNLNSDSIAEYEYNINKQLELNGIQNENGRLYIDCYMAKSTISLENEKKNVNVKCMAVGGDFFEFHPVKMLSGQYFSGSDLMHDGIILDEKTAWDLFGSYDIVDKQVYYGEKLLYVRGVYDRDVDGITDYARGDEAEIYVPYELLSGDNYGPSIVCMEFCLPNPVENFASKIITDVVKIDTNDYEMVENSTRFSTANLWKIYKEKKYRSMQNRDIIFPYWEKVARYQEDLLAPRAVAMNVCFITAGSLLVILLLYEITTHTRLKQKRDDV